MTDSIDAIALIEIEAEPGEHISHACARLAENAPAFLIFNDIRIEAQVGANANDLVAYFWTEMNRRSAEYEASDECKKRNAEFAIREKREAAIREERLAQIERSGIRTKCPWTDLMGEISGFGGSYEQGCRDMIYSGLVLIEERGANIDDETLEKAMLAAAPGCTGFMMGTTKSIVRFVATNGWDAFTARLMKRSSPEAS